MSFRTFFLILIINFPIHVTAQVESKIVQDSAQNLIIPIENIAVSSVKKRLEINEIFEELITDQHLDIEKQKNDSILEIIDSMLVSQIINHVDSLTARGLENQKNEILRLQSILEKEEKRLENIVQSLTIQNKKLKNDLNTWKTTRDYYALSYGDSLLNGAIEEVILLADSANKVVFVKMTKALSLVANSSKYTIKIEQLINKIEAAQKSRQEELFLKKYPPIYKLNLFDFSYQRIKKYKDEFYSKNLNVLVNFYDRNQNGIFYYFFFLLLLITALFVIRYKSRVFSTNKLNFYQISAINIIRRPVSLAIIFWIYSSKLFFTFQPPLISDLSILVLIIPILDILFHISQKGRNYMIVISFLFLLRFMHYIFPTASVINRYILLIMGVIEILLLLRIYKNINLKPVGNPYLHKLINFMILFHLVGAAIGLLTIFTGHLRIAEIAVDFPITNTLVGTLLIVSSVTVIGLIQLFIDHKQNRIIDFIQKWKEEIKTKVAVIIMFTVSLLWFNYILQILHLDKAFYGFLNKILTDTISLGNISFTLWNVFLFFFIIWISVLISRTIKVVLEDDVLKKANLKKGLPRTISVVARFSLITIGIIIAVSAVGMPLNQITIIFSAFSVGIGFGLQNVVNNFVSGIILLFERPVQIGDTIEVGTLIGTVKSMGIRSSNVRTFDGAEVVVPNANLISNEVINWTLSDRKRRIEIISGVAYGSDVHKVQKLLLEILDSHPDILKKPEPLVLFNNLGESSLDFRLLFWTDNFDNWIIIKSEVFFLIHDALNREGISIPFPQHDVHIKSYTQLNDKGDEDSAISDATV